MNHSKIRPATVRNRILWVLGQHGIEQATAQSIWDSLTSGNDPRPSDVPPSFTFQGVTIHWPSGVGRRIITPTERAALNRALKRNRNELLDSEDNAFIAREAYIALWHKHQRAMQELVEEATGVSIDPAGTSDETPPLDNVLCGHKKPGGRLTCVSDNHHAGLHANGKHAWTDDAVVIEHHAAPTHAVTAQPKPKKAKAPKPEPVNALDDLMAQLNAITTTNNALIQSL